MADLHPETKTVLGIMLREIEQTVLPDLSSPHARIVAGLISQGLRSLLTREGGLPALIDEWSQIEAELLIEAGRPSPPKIDDRIERNLALGTQLEAVVVERMGETQGTAPDEWCLRAVQAEHDFLAERARLIETVRIPERGGERRDLMTMTPDRLSRYFARKLPQYQSIRVVAVEPVLSGYSKQTFLVDMEVDGASMPVAIRRDIQYSPVVDSTVVDEYPVVMALHKYGMAVPEPVLLETDVSEFGEAFMVTRRCRGIVAASSMSGLQGTPEMAPAARKFAAFLARLHQIKLADLGLPPQIYDSALTTRDYLAREIDICERYYRNHRLQPSPTITAALSWLRANIPRAQEPPRLVHGDAWLTNVLMDGEEMSVVLDWELSHPGDANFDLAYGRKWMEQVMPWGEFLAHYYAHGGPPYHQEREKFHLLFSDLKIALYSVRTLDSLRKSEHPEISHMYSAQHYLGYFICRVAEDLRAL